jgi:hypothetical protein
MTDTPRRPILDAGTAQSPNAAPPSPRADTVPAPESLIAKQLPAWDLVPTDLLLVRRKAVKK